MPPIKAILLPSLLCLLHIPCSVFATPTAEFATHAIQPRNGTVIELRAVQSVEDPAEVVNANVYGACSRLLNVEKCRDCKHKIAETWDLCFKPGEYIWAEQDAILTNCMIDLHYRQDTNCISVKGSVCEELKGTSHIETMMVAPMIGDDSPLITSEASRSLQAASNFMIGEKVKAHVSDDDSLDGLTFLGARKKGDLLWQEEVMVLISYEGEGEC